MDFKIRGLSLTGKIRENKFHAKILGACTHMYSSYMYRHCTQFVHVYETLDLYY